MIVIRKPDEIYQSHGEIEQGTFTGRWHFSFDQYRDPDFVQFGSLRVFNDDTLSPGAVWPLHPHREIEVVTYCVQGEFRHADQNGKGGVLKPGWVQHTTVGKGMYHSEINNLSDEPMRFIQMWFIPSESGLEPAVQQMPVDRLSRTNRFLALISNQSSDALPIHSKAEVYSAHIQANHNVTFETRTGWGAYLYLLEGGPVQLNHHKIEPLGAAMLTDENELHIDTEAEAELLLVQVGVPS